MPLCCLPWNAGRPNALSWAGMLRDRRTGGKKAFWVYGTRDEGQVNEYQGKEARDNRI